MYAVGQEKRTKLRICTTLGADAGVIHKIIRCKDAIGRIRRDGSWMYSYTKEKGQYSQKRGREERTKRKERREKKRDTLVGGRHDPVQTQTLQC
jgi:hypothetical protein